MSELNPVPSQASSGSRPDAAGARCRRCGSRLGLDADWCTLCHTAVNPAPPVSTAPAVNTVPPVSTAPPRPAIGPPRSAAGPPPPELSEERIDELLARLAESETTPDAASVFGPLGVLHGRAGGLALPVVLGGGLIVVALVVVGILGLLF